jgi:hypothetical protein
MWFGRGRLQRLHQHLVEHSRLERGSQQLLLFSCRLLRPLPVCS